MARVWPEDIGYNQDFYEFIGPRLDSSVVRPKAGMAHAEITYRKRVSGMQGPAYQVLAVDLGSDQPAFLLATAIFMAQRTIVAYLLDRVSPSTIARRLPHDKLVAVIEEEIPWDIYNGFVSSLAVRN